MDVATNTATNTACSVISVFETREQAESAVRKVQTLGVDMKTLSIIGKGYHTEQHPIGFYTTSDRIKAWGGAGAFWGSIWGMLFGAAFFWVPGFGPLLVAGPFFNVLLGALEGAAMVGGIGALGAALTSIGVPKNHIIRYETDLKADKYLLIANGSPLQVEHVRQIMQQINANDSAVYDVA
jgi:uncharacterized membrane protein